METIKNRLKSVIKTAPKNEQSDELLEVIAPVLEAPGELSFKHHRDLAKNVEKGLEKFKLSHPKLVDEILVIINSLNDIGI